MHAHTLLSQYAVSGCRWVISYLDHLSLNKCFTFVLFTGRCKYQQVIDNIGKSDIFSSWAGIVELLNEKPSCTVEYCWQLCWRYDVSYLNVVPKCKVFPDQNFLLHRKAYIIVINSGMWYMRKNCSIVSKNAAPSWLNATKLLFRFSFWNLGARANIKILKKNNSKLAIILVHYVLCILFNVSMKSSSEVRITILFFCFSALKRKKESQISYLTEILFWHGCWRKI